MSIKEIAAREKVVRDIPVQLLRMGLERLVVHYRNQEASRHGSNVTAAMVVICLLAEIATEPAPVRRVFCWPSSGLAKGLL